MPEHVRSGLRPAARERAVRRHRAHRDAREADPRDVEPLAVARLRRRVPGRAGVQHVQGRGRDARAVARRHGRRGARQPRVRSRREEPLDKIDNWSQFPLLAANYAWDDRRRRATQRSLRDVVAAVPDLRRRRPQDRRDRHGQRGHADRRSSRAATRSASARSTTRRRSSSYVAAAAPDRSIVVVVVSHLGLDEDEGLTATDVEDPERRAAARRRRSRSSAATSTSSRTRRSSCRTTTSQYCKTHDCQTLLVHSGAFAKYVGRLDLVVHVGDDNADPRSAAASSRSRTRTCRSTRTIRRRRRRSRN